MIIESKFFLASIPGADFIPTVVTTAKPHYVARIVTTDQENTDLVARFNRAAENGACSKCKGFSVYFLLEETLSGDLIENPDAADILKLREEMATWYTDFFLEKKPYNSRRYREIPKKILSREFRLKKQQQELEEKLNRVKLQRIEEAKNKRQEESL